MSNDPEMMEDLSNDPEMRELIVGQIEAALPPRLINPEHVRQMLRVAKAEGFDPKALYAQASADRPEDWATPPPYEDVTPE